MTRRTYVYDPLLRKLVERPVKSSEFTGFVMGDLPDFVSPIDGKVVKGRRGLREHNRRHGVTNAGDYSKDYIASKVREDQRIQNNSRLQDIITTVNSRRG